MKSYTSPFAKRKLLTEDDKFDIMKFKACYIIITITTKNLYTEQTMQGDLIEIIEKKYPTMSKGQKKTSDYILKHYDKAAYMTASKLGETVGVSESTVVRFAVELGFSGYPEFHCSLQETLSMRLTAAQRVEVANNRISDGRVLETVLNSDAENIRHTLENINKTAFDNAVEALLGARRIYVIGMRSSAALAEFLDYNLSLVFEDVRHLRSTGGSEVFEQLRHINSEDVLVAVSFPRYSVRIVSAADYATKAGAKVISITDSMASPIAKSAYSTLTARSNMASFADSLVAPLSIINALLVAIGKKKKNEISNTLSTLESVWDEYGVYKHPSGAAK